MNALLGSELIEILSLERLVNQSRSLCHIVSVYLALHANHTGGSDMWKHPERHTLLEWMTLSPLRSLVQP